MPSCNTGNIFIYESFALNGMINTILSVFCNCPGELNSPGSTTKKTDLDNNNDLIPF